jgi:DNA-binding transcriptional ArsR family regulator
MSTIDVRDPKAMRALANPLRLKLLGLLRQDGPHSVGELSELADAAPGSVSYHLGTLARFGFVEEAPELARDGREKWWRASHTLTHFDPGELNETPEGRAAGRAFRETVLHGHLAEQLAALDQEPVLPRAWVDASTAGDILSYLSLDELARLSAELEAILVRWTRPRAEAAPDAMPIRLIFSTFRQPA